MINRIDQDPRLGPIYHVSLLGLQIPNPSSPAGVTSELSHLPLAHQSLDQSCLAFQGQTSIHPDYEEGYALWRDAFEAVTVGIFTISVADVVDVVQQSLQTSAA